MVTKKSTLFFASLLALTTLASCGNGESDLYNALKELKESKNYTVVSYSEFNKSSKVNDFLAFSYYNENQYYYRLEQEEYSVANGLISNDKGIYPIVLDENDKIIGQKIDYKSYKNKINSFWDPKYDRPGFQNLDLKYVQKEANPEEYIFKAKEFLNKQSIFFNTGLNFSYYLSAIKEIKVSFNDKGNLTFAIDLGEVGSIYEDIIDLGTTKIPEIDEFLANGGHELPSELNPKQVETMKLIDANNYREELGEVPLPGSTTGETIKQGAIYYHPDYYFIDYTDEYIKLYEKTYKTKIYDTGYYQLGNDVIEFKAEKDPTGKQEIEIVGEPIKGKKVPEVANYLSTTKFVKEYKNSQQAILPLQGGYLPFSEIQDYDLAKEIGMDVFHLDEKNFQEAPILMQSHSCGMTEVVNDVLIVLYSFNDVTNISYFPIIYDKFGLTRVELVEDYLANLKA